MYWKAFFVAIGNPKAIVFFTALFPQFINADAHQVSQYIVLVTTLSIIAFISFMIYALGGKQIGWLLRRPQAKKVFDRIIGSIFIGIGVNLATSEN
jgi:threonine/homoserine/homoserine lactone efflux protein